MRFALMAAASFGVALGLAACGSNDDGEAKGPTGGTGGSETGGTGGGVDGDAGTGGDVGQAGSGGDGSGDGDCPAVESIENARVDGIDVAWEEALLLADITAPSMGGPALDGLWFSFYSFATGTIYLGTGDNVNLYNCFQCLFIDEDYKSDGEATKEYFAESGSIDISTDPSRGWEKVTIKLNSVTFREFDLYNDVFIPDGGCYTIDDEYVFESGE